MNDVALQKVGERHYEIQNLHGFRMIEAKICISIYAWYMVLNCKYKYLQTNAKFQHQAKLSKWPWNSTA